MATGTLFKPDDKADYDSDVQDNANYTPAAKAHDDQQLSDMERHFGESADEPDYTGQAGGNEDGDTPSRDDLSDMESSASAPATKPTDDSNSLATKEKTADSEAPTPEKMRGPFKKTRGFLTGKKNKTRKRAALIGGAIAAIVGPILVMLTFLLLALEVPHFTANVAAWQFAKLTRYNTASTQNVLTEEAALNSADDSWLQAWRTRLAGMRDNTARNLERISGSIIVRNLNASGKLDYIKTPRGGALGKLGFERITAITVNDRSVLVPKSMFSYTGKFTSPIQTVKDRFAFYTALDDALHTYNPNVNTLVRSRAIYKMLGDRFSNIGFSGIVMSKFVGKNKVDAATEMQQEAYAVAEPKPNPPDSAPDDVKKATNEVAQDTENCMKDPKCAATTTGSPDGIVPAAADTADRSFVTSAVSGFIKGAVGFLNPLYAVAVPVCLVYSGSVFNAPASNNQSDAVQREATQVFAVDSQIKRGDIATNSVVNGSVNTSFTASDLQYNNQSAGDGALATKLEGTGRGIIDSNPLLRAGGQHPNTNQVGMSTQETAFGGHGTTTIFDVLLPSSVSGPLNSAANGLCPAATNIWAGAAIGAASLIIAGGASMVTAGSAGAAAFGSAEGAEAAAETGMQVFVSKIVSAFTTKEGAAQAFSKTGRFGYQFIRDVRRTTSLIEGATLLAKLMTFSFANTFHNGIATGVNYANDVDNGANQLSNTICQGSYYGRPLTYDEIAQNDQDDTAVRVAQAAKQSTYQRYLALSNPDSMLTKFGQDTVLRVNRQSVGTILSSLGNVFNPMSFLPKLFGSLPGKASAAASVEDENYGNVQCGYSHAEMALVNNTDPTARGTYSVPSQNAYILDNAGVDIDNAIDKEYGPCFTSKIGDMLVNSDSSGKKYLVLTSNGDINTDASVCSPQNLGPNNNQYGDLVFRYRLEHMYDTTIHGLYGQQTAGQAELGGAPAAL